MYVIRKNICLRSDTEDITIKRRIQLASVKGSYGLIDCEEADLRVLHRQTSTCYGGAVRVVDKHLDTQVWKKVEVCVKFRKKLKKI